MSTGSDQAVEVAVAAWIVDQEPLERDALDEFPEHYDDLYVT